MKPSALIILALLLVMGLTSFLFVRIEAGQGGTFVLAQQSAQRLTAAGVDRVVRTAPENSGGPRGLRASCLSSGHVGLGNPWRCLIIYPGELRLRYTVQIRLNGSYLGSDQVIYRSGQATHGDGQISGCCITVP
jgi:hypothetical protein